MGEVMVSTVKECVAVKEKPVMKTNGQTVVDSLKD